MSAKLERAKFNAELIKYLYRPVSPGKEKTSPTGKRKVTMTSLENKYRAIRAMEDGISRNDLSKMFDVNLSTLSNWMRFSADIKRDYEQGSFSSQTKRRKTAKFEDIEYALAAWINEKRTNEPDIKIDRNLVVSTAKLLAVELGVDDFTASNGWYSRFKVRHCLLSKQLERESARNATDDVGVSQENALREACLKFNHDEISDASFTQFSTAGTDVEAAVKLPDEANDKSVSLSPQGEGNHVPSDLTVVGVHVSDKPNSSNDVELSYTAGSTCPPPNRIEDINMIGGNMRERVNVACPMNVTDSVPDSCRPHDSPGFCNSSTALGDKETSLTCDNPPDSVATRADASFSHNSPKGVGANSNDLRRIQLPNYPVTSHVSQSDADCSSITESRSSAACFPVKAKRGYKMSPRSLEEKYRAVCDIENGHSRQEVIRAYRLKPCTLYNWIRQSAEIKRDYEEGFFSAHMKKRKSGKYEEIENALTVWIHEQVERDPQFAVSPRILKDKAKLLANCLGVRNFSANGNWVSRYRARNRSIKMVNATRGRRPRDKTAQVAADERRPRGEVGGAKQDDSLFGGDFPRWVDVMRRYREDDVYVAGEMSVFINHSQRDLQRVHSEDRLSVMLASNITGEHKLPLLVSGAQTIPNQPEVPITYKMQGDALITPQIITEWLRNVDNDIATGDRKILVIADSRKFPSNCREFEAMELVRLSQCNRELVSRFENHYKNLLDIKVRPDCDGEQYLHHALTDLQVAWESLGADAIRGCFERVYHERSRLTVKDDRVDGDVTSSLLSDETGLCDSTELKQERFDSNLVSSVQSIESGSLWGASRCGSVGVDFSVPGYTAGSEVSSGSHSIKSESLQRDNSSNGPGIGGDSQGFFLNEGNDRICVGESEVSPGKHSDRNVERETRRDEMFGERWSCIQEQSVLGIDSVANNRNKGLSEYGKRCVSQQDALCMCSALRTFWHQSMLNSFGRQDGLLCIDKLEKMIREDR